ncbi:COG1361 family protein [Mariniblastus fucicola]|uniref:Large cysteine-rich periplasmic protein OmcB n=1 Tax=Mariniblastus fucicola TaxID=980251 RepID=A0A5B9P431_9BACT|nr:DUF11 domain-containing protein [Mariniblastus fucicola]QEG20239.1 Large cysteine-rich periplasmic protein OmcB precursor [Mariniblastus fucicola]
MYRHMYRKCLLIAGLAGASLSAVQAQDHLIDGAKEEAARVIQLKNRIEIEAEETAADVSSRATRLASNPLAPVNAGGAFVPPTATKLTAPQVAFDEINSPQPLVPAPTSAQVSAPQVGVPQIKNSFVPPKVYVENKTPASNASFAKSPRATSPVAAPVRRSESAPFVTTTISAPEFVNVSETAPVRIDVRNPGKSTVYDVTLIATLPPHVKASSRQAQIVDGKCIFKVDSLQPGENRQLLLEIVTEEKQPLNIETALTLSNRNKVQVGVRKPQLVVSVEGPTQTNIGSKATHVITVTNTGDGIASNVNLIADIPESLRIVQKSGFETPENLRPGQQAQARIVTVPHQPGQAELAFAAEGNFCKATPAEAGLRVTQPELRVAAVGPDMNFVERDGIYTITIDNPGEVDVNNVEVQFAIPEGVKVTTISRQAKMDGPQRTLTWNFDRIQASTEQTIQLKAIASNEGEKTCRIRVASDETNEKEVSLKTVIATRAELSIQMQNVGGPVQVGSEATFVVIVENRGSSVANDMEIEVQLPAGMQPASPRDGVVDDDANSILFADSELPPGKTREFKFSAVGVEKGEHIVRSSLESVGSKQRIIVENSVFVYEPAQARVSESLQPSIPR